MDGASEPSEAALRAILSAADEIESLRGRTVPPEVQRGYLLRVANAVDRSLRRLLRDDPHADVSLRLQALAPDEMSADVVLAELRRNDRVTVELAAAVHELFEIRRRLEGGGDPYAGDGERAVRAADRVAVAAGSAPASTSPVDLPSEEEADHETEVATSGFASSRRRRGGRVPAWAIAAPVAVIVALAIGAYALLGRGPDRMEQGIALFRTGAYAEAAQYFWRYAEENPDEVTPHLYLARIHRRMNRPELAADAIREAQERAPEDPAVHRELGFLLLDTGRADVAIDRFRRAIELDEASSEGWVGLVRALREAGQPEEAARVVEQAPAEVRALLGEPGTS